MSLMVSLDTKQHWTLHTHWSQSVPNMSTWHLRTLSSTSSSCSGLNHASDFSINRWNWGVAGVILEKRKRKRKEKRQKNQFKYFSRAVLLVTLLNFHPNWWFGICRLQKPVQSSLTGLVNSKSNNCWPRHGCRGWQLAQLHSQVPEKAATGYEHCDFFFFLWQPFASKAAANHVWTVQEYHYLLAVP